MKRVVIGGGQGFWGDSNDAAIHMVRTAPLNYMACDYLAELTLSIMQRQKLKNPAAGYARDFIGLMNVIAEEAYKKKIGVLTNAGGMNIEGCVSALEKLAADKGMSGYKIGYVLGDDIKDQIPSLLAQGVKFENMDGVGDFKNIQDKILNVNVYHGHEPILKCLEMGADTVITGRSTDSALFLAPIMHELGWTPGEWDKLAHGIMVGHLLECGGQGAGGNYQYDWRGVPRMDELGFPIAEISDEEFFVTKAPDCGGIICPQSVKEQFLYEVHDPANYITPDVNVDISKARIEEAGQDRVRISDIHGKQRPDQLKLCVGYHAGWKVVTYLSFAWPDAYEKAQYAAEILMKKMQRKNMKAEDIHISYVGLNSLHLGVADMSQAKDINEVVLRIAVRSDEKSEVEKLIPEISPLQLNGPPGASFLAGALRHRKLSAYGRPLSRAMLSS